MTFLFEIYYTKKGGSIPRTGTPRSSPRHVEHTQEFVMLGEFKVLHVNLGKRKTAHCSLFCDESLASFDALAVVEPYICEDLDNGEPTFPVERNWQLFAPNVRHQGEVRYAYRAAMWVNKRHAAANATKSRDSGCPGKAASARTAVALTILANASSKPNASSARASTGEPSTAVPRRQAAGNQNHAITK